jgi:hypothetical protein
MTYVAIGCRILIGTVFLVAVAGKARSPERFRSFARTLGELRLVRRRLRPAVAAAVVAVEAAVPLLLAVPQTARAGLALAGGVLLVFTAALGRALRLGIRQSCQCFGVGNAPLSGIHLVRNSILAALAGLGAALPGAGAVTPPGVLVAATAGLVVALPLIRLDDLVVLFTAPARTR